MTVIEMPVLVSQEELDALVGEVELFLRGSCPPSTARGPRLSRGGGDPHAPGNLAAPQPQWLRASGGGKLSAWLATRRAMEVSAIARQRSPPAARE